MLKRVFFCAILLLVSTFIIAGDVASFIDEGFSADGKLYVFGQYGSEDGSWRGYAEIYTVDIEKNDYVDEGLFVTPASSKTQGKNGHTLYTDLRSSNSVYLDRLSLKSTDIDNVVYLRGGSKDPTETITIKDFEGSDLASYSVKLTPWYSGNTPSSQSSFFISVEMFDSNGKILGKQVIGNPDIKRRGVINYSIEKITRSPDGKSFIFLVEKTLATANGKSIRYMVETLEISSFK